MNVWIREKRLDDAREILEEAGEAGMHSEDLVRELRRKRSFGFILPSSAQKAAQRTIKWLEDHGEVLHDVDVRLYWRSA